MCLRNRRYWWNWYHCMSSPIRDTGSWFLKPEFSYSICNVEMHFQIYLCYSEVFRCCFKESLWTVVSGIFHFVISSWIFYVCGHICLVHVVLVHQDEILGVKCLRKLLKLVLCSCITEKLWFIPKSWGGNSVE